jgi:SSS family solute:Na+ symporter
VLVGLFTRRTPAIGAKIVIVFHLVAYGLAQFVFSDVITLHFLHLYAILFIIEVGIMLAAARWKPRATPWTFEPRKTVDLTPWRFTPPVAITLLSLVVASYLVFSPVGLAGDGPGMIFASGISLLFIVNAVAWTKALGRCDFKLPNAP